MEALYERLVVRLNGDTGGNPGSAA
jgi:hypothetical protein